MLPNVVEAQNCGHAMPGEPVDDKALHRSSQVHPLTSPATDAAAQWQLLCRFMRESPAQPATNLWRAIELPLLAGALPVRGRGLDVGCGDGVLTGILRDLLDAQWDLVGIDLDPAETNLAAQRGLYRTVHTTGANSVPEVTGSFDFAFANSVLEHIADLPACLVEVSRLLRPGGLFVATVPSPGMHDCLVGPGWFDGTSRKTYLRNLDARLVHINYWGAERWQTELVCAGLTLDSALSYMSCRQVRRWEALTNWTGGLLYRIWGESHRPIEIQRQFRLRRGLPNALAFLAPVAAVCLGGSLLGQHPRPGELSGGLLVVGHKPDA